MTKVIYETGRISEIGSGLIYGKLHYHSHILLTRDDGQVVRLEDVAIDDYVSDALMADKQCTIAFVHKNWRLPEQAGRQLIRNAVLGVSGADGYVSPKERPESFLHKLCFGIAGLSALVILFTRDSHHPTAWLFVGGVLAILFGMIGAANFKNAKNTNSVRDEINKTFESMGSKPQATIVYG